MFCSEYPNFFPGISQSFCGAFEDLCGVYEVPSVCQGVPEYLKLLEVVLETRNFFFGVCTYNHTYSGLIRLMLSASVGSLAMRRPCPCLACDVIPLPYVKTHGPASLPSLSPSVRSLLSLALSFFHLELHCSLHRPLRRQRAADREQAAPPNFTPLDKNQVAWCFMFFPNSGQATLCPISSTGELLRPRPLWINLPRPRWGAYAVSPSLFHHC